MNTSAHNPQTVINTDGGGGIETDPWSNVDNVKFPDDAYATCSPGSGDSSDYLDVTNFGFSLPATTTIAGIVVEVDRKVNASTSTGDQTVQLIVGGVATGNNKASADDWTTTEETKTYGSSVDTWGLSLLKTDVENINFGVRLQATASGTARTFSVDNVRIIVYYNHVDVGVKPTLGKLINIKPSVSSLLNVKPTVGLLQRQTQDSIITRLSPGMPIGPGFFMYLTYSEEIKIYR